MAEEIEQNISSLLAAIPAGARRDLRPTTLLPGGRLLRGNAEFTDFSSNDYLGLAHHPAIKERSKQWAENYGAGSGASRLVSGNHPQFEKIEQKIASLKDSEAALIMNSGFQANASVLSTLLEADKGTLLFTDKLNHASLHSGAKLAGSRQIRYRHNDLAHLEELLEKHQAVSNPSIIVTESVFSMDGDILNLEKISSLAQASGSFLYIDEAHATGVLGAGGAGLCKGRMAPLIMGTFGKAMGSFGAYIACSRELKDYIINRCPGFIYATALPPAVLGAIDAALDLLPSLDKERDRLKTNSTMIRHELMQLGFDCLNSSTQIIPVVIGSDEDVLRAGKLLEENGIICGIIRPPTVPRDTARLRLCISAAHSNDQISHLLETMKKLAGASKK